MQIVGVSFDDPDKNLGWAEDEGFAFELWTDDDDRTLATTYGAADNASAAWANRVTVLLDAEGELVLEYAVSGVATHPGEVLSDCEQLFAD